MGMETTGSNASQSIITDFHLVKMIIGLYSNLNERLDQILKQGLGIKQVVTCCFLGAKRKAEKYTFAYSNVHLVEPWLAQLQSLYLNQDRLKRPVTSRKSTARVLASMVGFPSQGEYPVPPVSIGMKPSKKTERLKCCSKDGKDTQQFHRTGNYIQEK